MYVCSCKAITEEALLEEIRKSPDNAEKISKRTGAGTDCGSCQVRLQRIVDAMSGIDHGLEAASKTSKS